MRHIPFISTLHKLTEMPRSVTVSPFNHISGLNLGSPEEQRRLTTRAAHRYFRLHSRHTAQCVCECVFVCVCVCVCVCVWGSQPAPNDPTLTAALTHPCSPLAVPAKSNSTRDTRISDPVYLYTVRLSMMFKSHVGRFPLFVTFSSKVKRDWMVISLNPISSGLWSIQDGSESSLKRNHHIQTGGSVLVLWEMHWCDIWKLLNCLFLIDWVTWQNKIYYVDWL